MAKDVSQLLLLVEKQVVLSDQVAPRGRHSRRRRLYIPRITWLWLARQPREASWEAHAQDDAEETCEFSHVPNL
jgi:hypothetical protein